MNKNHKNEKEIKELAHNFAKNLITKGPDKKRATIVALCGELGAGKTTFTKSAARALKIKEIVPSPTFVIMRSYKLQTTNYQLFIHIDAYRLKNKKELLHLGWKELVNDPKNLIFVEWPENIAKLIPKKAIKIALAHKGEGKREIKIKGL